MYTIKLTIAYDGTDYKGWQLQPNGVTIQSALEEAIEKVFKKHSRVNGASRTDAGVHAKGQVAHFKTNIYIPQEKIKIALNSVLPGDVAIVNAEYVDEKFHSRFDARSKRYEYFIFNSKEHDPFLERYNWRVPYKLDIPLMKREAKALIGKHDFKSFQATDKKERGSIREVYAINVVKRGRAIVMDISADGFLYNMVRNIAGTLVDIGRGYMPEGSMKKILESRSRLKAGPTAPPQGLFLMEVNY
ncbi:MAG TPA: tRNA pseudouridine(38-40) synthase TruA [Candidatus Omnitrophota bacterium]|nr:tRNA pseudouridine(38-40) synthase TruA [Candidatus Omnitrophota bacterium]HPS20553.1 tRNA pseudouridine(38-40) synthase TruA [Candidatus Omnitrophota bacterium]